MRLLFYFSVMNGVTEINGTGNRRLNQFGDYEDVSNMTVQDWEHRWELEQTLFHVPRVHPYVSRQRQISKTLYNY